MPPTKGPQMKQKSLGFKAVKLSKTRASSKKKPMTILSGNKHSDDALLKLRIPLSLCKTLPSVKKYSNSTKKSRSRMLNVDILDGGLDVKPSHAQMLLGVRRRRGEQQKYHLQLESEERFPGMVWDLTFLPTGQVVVGTSEGAFLCDPDLDNMQKLDKIQQAGGVGVLSDGRFVVICRFSDEVFIFDEDGAVTHSFVLEVSPTGLAINSSDELIITDTVQRCISIYDVEGKHLSTIPPSGPDYTLKWPLYAAVNEEDELFVSDCHLQQVLVFSKDGEYAREFPLKTFGGNFVLRPHGLAVNGSDVFMIDRGIDSMEVFMGDGVYLQTLLPSEEGVLFKPKVCCIDHTGSYLLLGSLSGPVRLYRFVDDTEIKEEPNTVKKEKIKKEIKSENADVILLD